MFSCLQDRVTWIAISMMVVAGAILMGCRPDPSPPLDPSEALATMEMDASLQLELVAAEPLVEDPIVITFDEDGRLWVVEMRGFMPDIDGTDEEAPVGRVSILTDSDGDGQMDQSVVFLDSLVLPRALAVVEGGALIAENKPLWFAKDTTGDLRADVKILVDPEYGQQGLVEHSPNGLWRGMDNWYYNAKSRTRYRYQAGQWEKEETEFRGQWGICHDDEGRLHYNYNWSQLHADLVPPNYIYANPHHTPTSGIDHGLTIERRIYPIRQNLAVNRGYVPGTINEAGMLREFASACAPFIYRGDLLSDQYRGNAFVCEPTANLIKRNLVREEGPVLHAQGAGRNKEFLASYDERFRPIFLASGPSGGLYIVDMYRGIIQHGPYMTSYLREVTLRRKLDKPINLGRIWRVVPEGWQPTSSDKLSQKSTAEWVQLLDHRNGWHRDMAQRLLVEAADPESIPLLRQLVRHGPDPLGRLHALWSLEGLGDRDPTTYLQAIEDEDPRVAAAAMRIIEPLASQDQGVLYDLSSRLQGLPVHGDKLALQMALTARVLPIGERLSLLRRIITHHLHSPLMRDAVLSSLEHLEYAMLRALRSDGDWQSDTSSRRIFLEMLATAITNKGSASEMQGMLEELCDPPGDLTWQQSAILTGMSNHGRHVDQPPIALHRPMDCLTSTAGDLAHLSDLFTWPGRKIAPVDTTGDKATTPQDRALLALGRQQYLKVCSGCHGTDGEGMRRFAPPLVDSEWVLGDPKRLALIVLHGMQGPVEVNGITYDVPDIQPVMPSLSVVQNPDIAAIISYIRQEWGHAAEPVSASTVGRVRMLSQGKVAPWTQAELREIDPDDFEIK